MKSIKWRAIVHPEENKIGVDAWWTAQCLDHHIAAQSRSLPELAKAFGEMLVVGITSGAENGRVLSDPKNYVPAPRPFWEAFEKIRDLRRGETRWWWVVAVPQKVQALVGVEQIEIEIVVA